MRANSGQEAASVVQDDLQHILSGAASSFDRLAGKRLLVTGGAGFLGYYLVKSILSWNDGVQTGERISLTLLDNFTRGVPAWLSLLGEAVTVVRHDVTEPLLPGIAEHEYVVHAASIASPTFYRRHPIKTMDANVTGLRRLLESAVDGPVEGLLFMSSSEVYGDPPADQIPTPETYRGNVSFTGPRACYDESKRFGETLGVAFAQEYGLPVKMARPFNNYGPGLKLTDGRVISDLARDVLENRDLVLLSDGSPTRTFCYVADAIVGYLMILTDGRSPEAYNIGTDSPEVSISDLAELMAAVAADVATYRGSVVHCRSADPAYLVDNPSRRRPDVTKARQELGFAPSIPLEEGLSRTLRWYLANRDGVEA